MTVHPTAHFTRSPCCRKSTRQRRKNALTRRSTMTHTFHMTTPDNEESTVIGALTGLVHLVNAHGTEFGITLLVQGRTISGTLTPNNRFGKWIEELLRGAAAGKTRRPVEQTPGLSDEEIKAVREDWEDFERRVLDQYPAQKAGKLLDQVYDQCCLRDVKVYGMSKVFGQTQVTENYPYLMVRMASVAALTFGIYEVTKEPETPNA